MKMNSKILDEIMNLMDEEDGKKLMKHPKLVAMKVTTAKPIEDAKEDSLEGESKDMENAENMMGDDLDEDTIMELLQALKKK
jgi:hypothetical protein